MKRLANLRPAALVALGVFLGRGAYADTILDFANQGSNIDVPQSFGDNVTASSDGITVTGFGTPNIGLNWNASGQEDTSWQFYNDSVWAAVQLNASAVGSTHTLSFAPNSASARVVVKSFNFHPYYLFSDYGERFTYDVTLLAGTNVVAGPTHITFQSDATKNHPVNINYTGAPGQTLKLRITRAASVLAAGENEGDPYDIAVDDIAFAQMPESSLPPGPEVVAVSPADDETGVAAPPSYLASITNGATTVVSSSIRLTLDGSPVSPTISSAGGLTNVSYQASGLLAPGSTHLYTLSYSDNLGANYTNQVVFNVANYPSLPAAYALPSGAGVRRGFTFRSVAARQDTPNLDGNVARAKAQLNGTLIDPDTSMPYTNAATLGTNADGSFTVDMVLNFNDGAVGAGNFPADEQFPGLDSGVPYNWFSSEGVLYLDLPAGYYRFGVNSDDGFAMEVKPPAGISGSPLVVGAFDGDRAPGDTLFDVLVQTPGVYCFNLIYFESTGGAEVEFYSVDLATGEKVLVNDAANPNAIKSYSVLRPRITSIVRNGSNVTIDWAYGTPPFQLQFKNDLAAQWSNIGGTTTNRTASVPIQPGAGFIRLYGQ